MNVSKIFLNFPINEEEYAELDERFGQLCNYAAWQLIKKNTKNNNTDDHEDIAQELRLSILRAGSYYKRQVFLESCFEATKKYAKDQFTKNVLKELHNLWQNRTRHGANRQKFGEYQEKILERITNKMVPKKHRPNKKRNLRIDTKFTTYCKAITWNCQKTMGKKITREKSIRAGQVSLSDYDYLAKI
jgi:hypothetical protein